MKEFFKNKVLVVITSIFSVLILTLSIVGGVTINNLNNEINNLNNQIEEMNQTDDDLSFYIEELELKLNTVESTLNATNSKIDELETAFGEDLDETEESILNDLNTLKTSLENEVRDIKILIDGLTSKDSALEARIAGIETSVNNLNATLNTLITQVNQNKEEIEELDEIISSLETKLNTVETSLNATNTKIEELETAFGEDLNETEESILNDLNTLKTSLENEVRDIKTLIDGLISKDSALEARIASLETSVDNLNATLNALITQVNQNKEEIEELEKIISSLETRIYCLEDNHQKLNIRYTYQVSYLLAEEYCIHCDDVVEYEYAYYNDVDGTYYYNFTNEKFEDQSITIYEYDENENTYLIYNGAGLSSLINNANNGATFKLMNDIEVLTIGNLGDEFQYSIVIQMNNTILDLNGYEMDCQNYTAIHVADDCTLTIYDTSESQTGVIKSLGGISIINAKLILNGGTINSSEIGVSCHSGTVTMNGGTIDCEGYDLSGNGTIYLGVNSQTDVGATFLNGLTIDEEPIINFVDTHIEYYDAVGNLITLEDAANTTTIIKLVYHDENHDHLCDCGCGKVLSKHLDVDYDCSCDYCDETLDYNYNETINTYLITNGDVINEVIALAEVSGTSESPATIKLLNDLEGSINSDYGVEFSYIGNITTGNIVLDLNGYTLDGGNAKYVFIIGEKEINSLYYTPEVTSCDASFTIIDSSDTQTGKIVGKEVGIKNHGQSLTIDGGTIEISCTEENVASAIESSVGTLTINGGNFIVSSTSHFPPKGIYVRDDCVLYMYGGNLTVTNTVKSSYGISLDSIGYIYGGTIDCETCDIIDGTSTVYLGVNEKTGVGATFVDGLTIWSFMTVEFIDDSITYYDEEGNVLTLEEASSVTTIVMCVLEDIGGRE